MDGGTGKTSRCLSHRLAWQKSGAGYWKNRQEEWFDGPEGPQALFRRRVLPFDENAGVIWGHLMAAGNTTGRPRTALDMTIAAIAHSNNCVLVTDNERHFPGIDLLNPLRCASGKRSGWTSKSINLLFAERMRNGPAPPIPLDDLRSKPVLGWV